MDRLLSLPGAVSRITEDVRLTLPASSRLREGAEHSLQKVPLCPPTTPKGGEFSGDIII